MCVWTAGCDVIRKVSLHFPCERADGKSRRPVHEAEEAAWLWNFLDFLVCVRVRVLYFFSRVKLSAVLSDHALKKKKKKVWKRRFSKSTGFWWDEELFAEAERSSPSCSTQDATRFHQPRCSDQGQHFLSSRFYFRTFSVQRQVRGHRAGCASHLLCSHVSSLADSAQVLTSVGGFFSFPFSGFSPCLLLIRWVVMFL